ARFLKPLWLTELPTAVASESKSITIRERALQQYYELCPVYKRVDEVGVTGLTPKEFNIWAHSQCIRPLRQGKISFPPKVEREFWKFVEKENIVWPQPEKHPVWGKDKNGRDLGTYTVEEYEKRNKKASQLVVLDIYHDQFLWLRESAKEKGEKLDPEVIEEEKKRRKEMAALKHELYGVYMGPLAQDPEWDDIVPIPLDEPEDALAKIAYPDYYAEAVSYLRAVMARNELSQRSLRLTEHVISMNPAHYTVWLYRIKIVKHRQIPISDEIEWLNEVALGNLKNYQIWHHRQLLLDYHYPSIAGDESAVKELARSEIEFVTRMLDEDTKNYHVWSYRHNLVGKLGLWNIGELLSTQNLIEDDLRNNSAWSHRFFLVFDDPKLQPQGGDASAPPTVPDDVLDREVNYAKEKIALAPQNQSAWNYLRGALTRGGRPFGTVQQFAEQFVSALGQDAEEVRSSHALDMLAEIYADQGDRDRSRLALQRLGEKWDPVREGYWKYRVSQLETAA
ncbi:hypothetical protein S40293_05132, partial [Stachybotrys chartarum IBT 40293]